MKLHILTFKNYLNRQALRFTTLAEYEPYEIYSVDGIDFNRADGVNTQQVINTDTAEQGDYLVVSDNGQIVSRWYIMENKWNRMGQVILSLHRDLIVDFYDEIIQSDCTVMRAMLGAQNPLIFNPEKISVNRIKKSETLLRDETGVPWITAYIAKDAEISGSLEEYYYKKAAIDVDRIVNLPLFGLVDPGQTVTKNTYMDEATRQLNVYVNPNPSRPEFFDETIYKYTYRVSPTQIGVGNPNLFDDSWDVMAGGYGVFDATYIGEYGTPSDYYPPSQFCLVGSTAPSANTLGVKRLNKSETYERMKTIENTLNNADITAEEVQKIKEVDGKIYRYISDFDNTETIQYRYVKYTVTKSSPKLTNIQVSNATSMPTAAQQLFGAINSEIYTNARIDQATADTSNLSVSILGEYTTYTITCEILTSNFASTPETRYQSASGNYDIICSPLQDYTVRPLGGNYIQSNGAAALLLYQAMANLNKDEIYDIQILPFCPARQGYVEGVPALTATDYTVYNVGGNDVAVLNVQKDQMDFSITSSIPAELTDAAVRKRNIICDRYRLCDPGYNGVFEFTAEANNGVARFNVDMTVKPFNPFIHIAPDFGGLYGDDYNDARGLTLGSNTSITTTSDKWAEFELNNKNYQEIFNRQIQNMEKEHNLQDLEAIATSVSGGAAAAVSGATAGAMLGSAVPGFGTGVGAIIGGTIGGLTSAGAGIADYMILQQRQAEQINYATDMFNYQLDNIKALPDSLTRVTTLNGIYKYFPFVEKYSCTNEEKEVVDNYIKWNSMNVNAIGKIRDYIQSTPTFIQATPLRLDIDEDTHLATEVARELSNGIYI